MDINKIDNDKIIFSTPKEINEGSARQNNKLPEPEELIPPEVSLASKAYASSQISNNTNPIFIIKECINYYRPKMVASLKNDILNTVTKYNMNLGKILISDDDITDEMIKEVLETTNDKNEKLRIKTHDFLKEHKEDFGEYYISAATILLANMNDYGTLLQLPSFLEKVKKQCNGNHLLFSKMMKSFAYNSENADYILDTFLNNREKFGSDSDTDILTALYDKSYLLTNVQERFMLDEYLHNENLYKSEALRELIVPIITSTKNSFNKYDAMEFISKSNFNTEEIKKLKSESYKVYFEKLQNSNGYNLIFKKNKTDKEINNNEIIDKCNDTEEETEVENIVRMTPKGDVTKSRLERFHLKDGELLIRTRTSDNKYSCDSYYRAGDLTKEIRIVNSPTRPLYIQKTVASPIMEGVYDTTIYDLDEIDENIDVLDAIEKGEIKGHEISKTFENPDGTKTHIEEFQKGEFHTKREYSSNDDGTKTSLNYSITDLDGGELLNVQRDFELNGNKSITTLNGKKYAAEFDDENMVAKVNGAEINFKEKMQGETAENQEKLWGLIKKTPGDLILKLANLKELKYLPNNGRWNRSENRISSDNNLGTLSHETGHLLDDASALSEEGCSISSNKELINIYNEEIEDFKKNISEAEQENISYFSQTGGSGNGTGLAELVAEVNMLLTTQINPDNQLRGLYLTRYFPKTAAKIAELLGYNSEI